MKKLININSIRAISFSMIAGLGIFSIAAPANADFVAFEIRNSPTIIDNGTSTEFIIDGGGDKAALGSNDINGSTIGSITSLSIERLDDPTRFTSGTGPNVAPYFNLWITDGAGNYAVVANEPSNGAFQPLYNNGYDLSFADLSNKVAKIYENSDTSWLPNPVGGLTFADLAGFIIKAPTIAELNAGWAGLGTGAPRELGTNVAYGVNWVFGDTLANYVSGDQGYVVANANVQAANVSEPTIIALFGLGLLWITAANRRKVHQFKAPQCTLNSGSLLLA